VTVIYHLDPECSEKKKRPERRGQESDIFVLLLVLEFTATLSTALNRGHAIRPLTRNFLRLGLVGFLLLGTSRTGRAQWIPPPSLQNVPVTEDCTKTRGGIGISFQPSLFDPQGAIFLCPQRALEIDRAHPGASLFFRVHEYGHLALHTRNEALADGWAAEQLSHSVSGRTTLEAVLAYFTHLGKRFALMYGTGYDRALTVAESGQIPQKQWPAVLVEYDRIMNEKRARNGTIRLRIADCTADGLLWIDDQLVGFVSSAGEYRNPPMPDLSGQTHRLQLQDMCVNEMTTPNKLIARGIDAFLAFQGGNSTEGLLIDLNYQAESLIVSVPNQR
jgi:hypothetical protein